MSNRKYTAEQIDFLRDNVKGRSYKELTALFNERFAMDLPVSTVTATTFRHGFKNGIDARFNKGTKATQFKKGNIPHNKGKKGLHYSPNSEFKKGNIPSNYRPIGSERISREGYIEIKTADPNRWRHKHRVLWEDAYGPVPKGHTVIFADSNKINITLDNLLLVSRAELLMLNKFKLISDTADLTKTGLLIAKLCLKINEREKNK